MPAKLLKFRNSLLETLCEYKVNFYLSGHEHQLEINKFECETNKHVLVSIVSGAAGVPASIIPAAIAKDDPNLLWINGVYYQKGLTFDETPAAIGFAFLEIKNDTLAHIRLILPELSTKTNKTNTTLQDGNFIYRKVMK